MKISVLIPAYNAQIVLKELIERIKVILPLAQIVVVDDGSSDETRLRGEQSGATVLVLTTNLGKGAALQTGFDFLRRGNAEFILTMDADLQHLPEDIPNLISERERTNADIIVGWRRRDGTAMPLHRRMSNRITSALVAMRTGAAIKDSQCGFRLIKKNVIELVQIESHGFEAETEFLIKAAKAGFSIASAPVQTVYGGEKSYMTHWSTTVNFLRILLREYR